MKVFLKNETGMNLYVTGSSGSDWGTSVQLKQVPSSINMVQVGQLADRSGPGSNYGWIYLSLQANLPPLLQIYVAASSSSTYDYAVQFYDEGRNDTGQSILQSAVAKIGEDPVLTVTELQVTWIGSLRGAAPTRMLHQITIPGTHDSGTFRLGSLSKCQSMSLEEQLLGGVRFFDIRVDCRTNALKIIHGDDLLTGYVFDDFANMVSRFLKATEETVVMQVHDERGNPAGLYALLILMLESALNPDQFRLYAAPIRMNVSAIPSLKDLKGKAVLIRRYPYSNQEDAKAGTPVDLFGSGADFNHQSWSMPQEAGSWAKYSKLDWPDGGKGWSGTNAETMGPGINDCRNRHGLSFVIQDKYSIEDLTPPPGGSNADAKFNLVKQYLDGASHGPKPDSWFLNYASCTEYMGHPENYAVIVNAGLMNYFATPPQRAPLRGFGTIMMDFVDTGLLGFVIRSNWPL